MSASYSGENLLGSAQLLLPRKLATSNSRCEVTLENTHHGHYCMERQRNQLNIHYCLIVLVKKCKKIIHTQLLFSVWQPVGGRYRRHEMYLPTFLAQRIHIYLSLWAVSKLQGGFPLQARQLYLFHPRPLIHDRPFIHPHSLLHHPEKQRCATRPSVCRVHYRIVYSCEAAANKAHSNEWLLEQAICHPHCPETRTDAWHDNANPHTTSSEPPGEQRRLGNKWKERKQINHRKRGRHCRMLHFSPEFRRLVVSSLSFVWSLRPQGTVRELPQSYLIKSSPQ